MVDTRRNDIAESLNRIANGIKLLADGMHLIDSPETKKLFVLRLQNDARELNELTKNISHLIF